MDKASQRISTQKGTKYQYTGNEIRISAQNLHREAVGSHVYMSYTVLVRQTVIKRGTK
jgi:hypothetical protein